MEIIERKRKWREGPYQGYARELVEKEGRRLFHTAVDIGWRCMDVWAVEIGAANNHESVLAAGGRSV